MCVFSHVFSPSLSLFHSSHVHTRTHARTHARTHVCRVYKDANGPHEVTGVAGGKTVQVEKDNFKDTGEVHTKWHQKYVYSLEQIPYRGKVSQKKIL